MVYYNSSQMTSVLVRNTLYNLYLFVLLTLSQVSVTRRQELFFEAFVARRIPNSQGGQSPFGVFVKKLQESLTRMENLDVVTVSQSSDGMPLNVIFSKPETLILIPHRFQTKLPLFTCTSTPITFSCFRRLRYSSQPQQHNCLNPCYCDVPSASRLSEAQGRRNHVWSLKIVKYACCLPNPFA